MDDFCFIKIYLITFIPAEFCNFGLGCLPYLYCIYVQRISKPKFKRAWNQSLPSLLILKIKIHVRITTITHLKMELEPTLEMLCISTQKTLSKISE
jgi:hypothetical protein